MYKNQRWIHSTDVLLSREDSSVTVSHPSVLTEWADDIKQGPDVSYIKIVNYLIFSEGVDGRELCCYKSTEAYNYPHRGWERTVEETQQVYISEGRQR